MLTFVNNLHIGYEQHDIIINYTPPYVDDIDNFQNVTGCLKKIHQFQTLCNI